MRIRAIDNFRGLSIMLMVFFTLILRLSNNLPDLLTHNVPSSLHLGDFVLPMFLFASGMSMVFFAKKREKKDRLNYALDITERFGRLVIISFFLTPFSSGEILGMDEVMLSAVLFIPTILLISYSGIIITAVGLAVFLLYFLLQQAALLPAFTAHYLGGYPAAVFYLPVMLAGAIAGKHMNEIKKLLVIATILSLLSLMLFPPYKMGASPSFMMLSVVFSLAIFLATRNIANAHLEYLGKKPLRYWVLMFVVFLVPLTFYVIGTGSEFPLGFDWPAAIFITLASLPVLYFISGFLDMAGKRIQNLDMNP